MKKTTTTPATAKKTKVTPVKATKPVNKIPKVTKTSLVKNHLINQKTITSLQAIELYSVTRLSDNIFRMRKKGFGITTKDTVIKDRFGNACTYGLYTLVSMPKKK